MRSFARGAVATAVALALACGGSGNTQSKQLFAKRKTVSDGLVAAGATLNDAATAFAPLEGGSPDVFTIGAGNCVNNLVSLANANPPGPDHCDYGPANAPTQVCLTIFEWFPADSDLCASSGLCWYHCELRTMASEATPDPTTKLSAAHICASEWVSGTFGVQ